MVSAVEVRLVVIISVLEEVVTDVELVVVNDVLEVGIVVVSEVEVVGNEVVEEEVVSVVNVVCVEVVSFNGLVCLFSSSTMASGSCLWGVPNPFRTSSLTPCWVVSAVCLSSEEGSGPLKAS